MASNQAAGVILAGGVLVLGYSIYKQQQAQKAQGQVTNAAKIVGAPVAPGQNPFAALLGLLPKIQIAGQAGGANPFSGEVTAADDISGLIYQQQSLSAVPYGGLTDSQGNPIPGVT